MAELNFPKHFLWGAATSAHQVEGQNINSDWWNAELSGLVPFPSGQSADHYHLFMHDFAAAKSLGHNAHRLSLEWSRLEPRAGQFDVEATNHYRQVILELRENGLEPVITLHHFTNPQWFTDRGGWSNPKAAKLFSRYVTYCIEHFGDYINWWVTINEPTVYATMSYGLGLWPPFRKSYFKNFQVIRNMAKAHRMAYSQIKKHSRRAHVGIAHNMSAYNPARRYNPLDIAATWFVKYFGNTMPLQLLRGKYDFIGLNYYWRRSVRFGRVPGIVGSPDLPHSDLGWEIAPQGLLQVLRELHRYRKPVLITENGIADADDSRRWPFILNHLLMIYAAISEGIHVSGYLYWSLLDNFEWSEGFEPRFGLIAVDYESQKRTVRDSAQKYAEVAKHNRIEPEMIEPFYEQNKNAYPEVIKRHLKKITKLKPEN